MPINVMSDNSESVKFYKLKKFEYAKQYGHKTIKAKAPAFVVWNKETKQEEFASDSFGGSLTKVVLKEPQTFTRASTGMEFISQDVNFEFTSANNQGEIEKEIIVVNRNSVFFESLVSKLIFEENFDKIAIKVGRFVPKGKTEAVDFVSIFNNGKKLPVMVGTTSEEYPLPEGAIVLPPKIYKDVKKKTVDPESKKAIYVDAKEIDENWVAEKDQIFDKCLETLIENVANYASQKAWSKLAVTHSVETQIDEKEEELPEVTPEELNQFLNGKQMPF